MRIGVVRGDLLNPLFLSDLESTSQSTVNRKGQTRYISRPANADLEAILASSTVGVGAVIEGSDIAGSFPITINAGNDDLKVRLDAAAAYTTVLIAQAAYASLTLLLAAINTALAGTGIVARQGTGSGQRVAIESLTRGTASYIQVDSTAGGSVANTPLGFGAATVIRTVPPVSAFIAALNPVAGTLDVSNTTLNAVGAGTATNALNLIPSSRGTNTALADSIAPQFAETSAVEESYLVGCIAGFRSASFNPDPRRVPALSNSAAIACVQDDGSTAYAPGLPVLTTASLAGSLTISGTGLGATEKQDTTVKLSGNINRVLTKRQIIAAGGTATPTSIVIPVGLLAGAAVTVTSAQVKVRNRVSAVVVLT